MANLPDSWLWPAVPPGRSLNALWGTHSCVPHRQSCRRLRMLNSVDHWLESAALTLGFEAQPAETTYADFERHLLQMGPALIRIGPKFLAILPGSMILTPGFNKNPPRSRRHPILPLLRFRNAHSARDSGNTRSCPDPTRETSACTRRHPARTPQLETNPRHLAACAFRPARTSGSNSATPRFPVDSCARRRPCHPISCSGSWRGTLSAPMFCAADVNRSWLIPWSLLLADAGSPARPHYAIARRNRDRRGRALKAAPVLRLAAPGSRQHPPSRRGAVARTRTRIGSGGSAGIERRLSRFGGTHRNRRRHFRAWRQGPAACCNRRFSLRGSLVAAGIAWSYFQRNRIMDRCSPPDDARFGGKHGRASHAARAARGRSLARWRRRSARTVFENLQSHGPIHRPIDRPGAARLAGPRPARFSARVRFTAIASPARIAIAVGGTLLAYRAWKRLAAGAWQLAGAAVAWQRTSVLFRAATRQELPGSLDVTPPLRPAERRGARFGLPLQRPIGPVLRGANLQIASGDRLVLEGPSGGGKSTLVSLLTGVPRSQLRPRAY